MRSALTIPHTRPPTTRTFHCLRTTTGHFETLHNGDTHRGRHAPLTPSRSYTHPTHPSRSRTVTRASSPHSPRRHPTSHFSPYDASHASPTRGAYLSANTSAHLRRRGLASIQSDDRALPSVWFNSRNSHLQERDGDNGRPIGPNNGNGGSDRDSGPPDERTLKLGKTTSLDSSIRILQERLPTLLASPLPQEILSPHISLHLFPSTHPHLPTVSGRVAYLAALWTAPVAWGRVPIVGNVKLIILSERMVKGSSSCSYSSSPPSSSSYPPAYDTDSPPSDPHSRSPHGRSAGFDERLIVRWRTCGKTKGKGMGGALYRGIGAREQVDKITEFLGGHHAPHDDEEFTGLFIFEFDDEGRILSHTIEHVDETGNWDKMAKVISVTDWLLGKARWKRAHELEEGLALGFCETAHAHVRHGGKRE
ncbi:hypothetical protein L228DRAFT_240391 [Xylona heveae TC161]|uniref:Uncharacterized protein n=1 Tax=Xylona heveae (strain CBS 132557 / TC161) TaxID=1328760 RepID=A0A165AK11_XYLHT|nr:hypothetical protein L228DRAFT_240391 [Xylona heveae TC161]KZF20611.1 hypothetical protein L228DRAFT_240391 [Xylona heveae TC161]